MQKKTVSVSLRITERQRDGLAAITRTTSLTQATLIDIAIDGLLEYAKAHRGRLVLPIDFESVWRDLRDLERRVDTHLNDHPLDDDAPRSSRLTDEGREDVRRAMDSAADKRNKDRSSSEKP